MNDDDDEEMLEMPQPASTDGASETDDDVMNESAEASDSSHCHDYTRINGISRAT